MTALNFWPPYIDLLDVAFLACFTCFWFIYIEIILKKFVPIPIYMQQVQKDEPDQIEIEHNDYCLTLAELTLATITICSILHYFVYNNHIPGQQLVYCFYENCIINFMTSYAFYEFLMMFFGDLDHDLEEKFRKSENLFFYLFFTTYLHAYPSEILLMI